MPTPFNLCNIPLDLLFPIFCTILHDTHTPLATRKSDLGMHHALVCTCTTFRQAIATVEIFLHTHSLQDLHKLTQFLLRCKVTSPNPISLHIQLQPALQLYTHTTHTTQLVLTNLLRANLHTLVLHGITPDRQNLPALSASLLTCQALRSLCLIEWNLPQQNHETLTNPRKTLNIVMQQLFEMLTSILPQLEYIHIEHMYDFHHLLAYGVTIPTFYLPIFANIQQQAHLKHVHIAMPLPTHTFFSITALPTPVFLQQLTLHDILIQDIGLLPVTIAATTPWLHSLNLRLLSAQTQDADIFHFINTMPLLKSSLTHLHIENLTHNPYMTENLHNCVWYNMRTVTFINVATTLETENCLRERVANIPTLSSFLLQNDNVPTPL